MPKGGFVIKIEPKKIERCYAIKFDYDEWTYTINEKVKKPLPPNIKTITIQIEDK